MWLISIAMAIPIPIPRMLGMRVEAGYARYRGRDPPAVGRPSIIKDRRGEEVGCTDLLRSYELTRSGLLHEFR